MGHRSLPASLPFSAWVLATSTAAGPGRPEHTIQAWGGGMGREEGAPERARRLLLRPLRICKRRRTREKRRRRRRGGGGGAPPSPPASSTLVPSPGRPGSAALRNWPSGWVRAGGRRRLGSVTPDQLMPPACNWSWVSGSDLSTSLPLPGAIRISFFPLRLWMHP